MVTLGKSFNPKGNAMNDTAANLATLPEPEWVPWGDGGFRLEGTNWTVRPILELELWDVVCGRKYLGNSPMLEAAKHHAVELRRLMAEEPAP